MKTAQAAARPRIQNREPATRRVARAPRQAVTASRLRVAPEQAVVRRPRRRQQRQTAAAPLPNGLSVMGLLVGLGAAIGLMLVVSLGWQRNAYGLAQQEVALRSALDQTSDEHQQLLVEKSRASNPRNTAAHANDAGLNDFKLDERTAGQRTPVAAKAASSIAPAKSLTAPAKSLTAPVQKVAEKETVAKPQAMAKPASLTAVATASKAPQPLTAKLLSETKAAAPIVPPTIAKAATTKAALAR